MATNPIDPNSDREPQLQNRGPRLQDPNLRPPGEMKRQFPWGIVGAIIVAAILGWLIWYFVAGAPGK